MPLPPIGVPKAARTTNSLFVNNLTTNTESPECGIPPQGVWKKIHTRSGRDRLPVQLRHADCKAETKLLTL